MSVAPVVVPPKFILTKFEIAVDSGSDQLYANGRQQVKVLITLTASTPAFGSYTLSADELNSIRLIEYNKVGVELPYVGEGDAVGWGYSTVRNVYKYHAVTVESETQANQYVELYVQTTADSQLKIGARILNGGTTDGVADYYATNDADSLNDSVTLRPVNVPAYSRQNLAVSKVKVHGDSDVSFSWDTVDYYSFSLLPQSGGAAFLNIQTPPLGICKFDAAPHDRGSAVGWAGINTKTISYFDNASFTPNSLEGEYPQAGRGTLVLVRKNSLYMPGNPPTGSDSIKLRDEYGNDYTIPFSFGDTRSTLVFN